MTRVNIELALDGDPETAMRAIDALLDQGVIQDSIEMQVARDGEHPIRVTHACSVWVLPKRDGRWADLLAKAGRGER